MTTLIKTTLDGRRVEVVDRAICLDGQPEATTLVPVQLHPNATAILEAVPEATHVAGRLPLTRDEAARAQAALEAAYAHHLQTPAGASERMRLAVNEILRVRSDE